MPMRGILRFPGPTSAAAYFHPVTLPLVVDVGVQIEWLTISTRALPLPDKRADRHKQDKL